MAIFVELEKEIKRQNAYLPVAETVNSSCLCKEERKKDKISMPFEEFQSTSTLFDFHKLYYGNQ